MSINMKAIKQIFFIILLCVSYNNAIAQNLGLMPGAKRDSLLIAIAKEAIMKYGPDYYRGDFPPVIERHTVPPKGEINKTGENAGRVSYWVTFLYDKTEETLEWDYAARVTIWEDTGYPTVVMFGNGIGTVVPKGDWRNDTTIEPIAYQESTRPIYGIVQIVIQDTVSTREQTEEYAKKLAASNPNNIVRILPDELIGKEEQIEEFTKQLRSSAEPINKDELIRKGWVKQSDGEWVKTTPDVPPHKRNR